MAALLVLDFTGADSTASPQSVSLPGAKVGDTVVLVANATNGGAAISPSGTPFEAAITVDDEIQQSQTLNFGNLGGNSLKAFLMR